MIPAFCFLYFILFLLDQRVTRDIIQELAASGAVNSLRLPVGDYMYKSYGPYDGCFDGALEYIDELLDWAYESGLTVLIDVSFLYRGRNILSWTHRYPVSLNDTFCL